MSTSTKDTPMKEQESRSEVARFMRRLYRQRLTTTSGGNISQRIKGGLIAITPAGLDKGRLRAGDIALIRMNGKLATRGIKPTSEWQMHLMIYERCPKVNAIVHAHPATACAFCSSGTAISTRLIEESYLMVPRILKLPYARTGSEELARTVAEGAAQAEGLLLENHGVVATGETLLQAFDRIELIESAAQMTLAARQLDMVRELPLQLCAELDKLMGR
ncbi:class II aldolase/adducin family protein [bacterium]|nr:class II aldolase/adducin family protein [bacterium]